MDLNKLQNLVNECIMIEQGNYLGGNFSVDLKQVQIELDQAKQLTLTSVGVTLPSLVIEEHHKKYMAYLKGVKGIVAQGDTKEDAVNELMLLIKIKLLYDLGN